MESLNSQVMAALKALEIKHHTVPRLKALKHSIEHTSGYGHGTL